MGDSRLPVTPAPGEVKPFGLQGHLRTCTHTRKNKYFKMKATMTAVVHTYAEFYGSCGFLANISIKAPSTLWSRHRNTGYLQMTDEKIESPGVSITHPEARSLVSSAWMYHKELQQLETRRETEEFVQLRILVNVSVLENQQGQLPTSPPKEGACGADSTQPTSPWSSW